MKFADISKARTTEGSYCGMKSDDPFSYLTRDEFLALAHDARVAHLQNVSDYLTLRAALLTEPQDSTPS